MDSGSQYVSKLNEYTQKMRIKPPVYEDLGSSGPDHMKIFTQRVCLEGKTFPDALGITKKIAKHNAAKNAYEILMGQQKEPAFASKTVETSGRDVNDPSRGTGDVDELREKTIDLNVSKQNTSSTNKADFVSMVNIYCQKTKRRDVNYIEETPEAQSQKPFAYRIEINQQHYPVGTGMNKREAKQMAAQLAWSALQKQSDWDSKVSVGSTVSQGEESEMSLTSATGSNLLEPDFSRQSAQSSSGCSWIQFKQSSETSLVQENSSGQETGLGKKTKNGLTTKPLRFTSDYDCIEPLGNGAYGCVYKAKHRVLEKYRAIKEIQSKDIQKSLQEVKVLSELLHENIVRYFSCWFEDTGYRCQARPNVKFLFIEMELCDGGTLRRWIHKKNREPEENSRQKESLDLAGQIISGVVYIHSQKLIHRDLKPENIFFGHDGKVRIGDFGLVTQDNNDDEIVERTEERGTHSYMAPEQFGVKYDRKVDIWALGLILCELYWRLPTGHERAKIWRGVRNQDLPKEFSQTYPIESRIIKTMLSEKPGDRPEASTVKSELDKWTRALVEDINQKTV